VLLTFLGAGAARNQAELDGGAEDVWICLGLPDQDAAGGVASVGAVEAETDAADHLPDVRLGQIGVGTTRAGRSAEGAVFDAPQQQLSVESAGPWVCLDHVSIRHVPSLPVEGGGSSSEPQPLGRART